MKTFELSYNISNSSRVNSTQYKHLSQEDIIKDHGIDYKLYFKILVAKGINFDEDDFKREYDTRDGYTINGRKLNKRYHKYHDLVLIKNGIEYVVDAVHEIFYFGEYISLTIRERNSKSHAVIYWENINCHEDIILESIKVNKQIYKIKE